jgi:hypothetical protein
MPTITKTFQHYRKTVPSGEDNNIIIGLYPVI